MRSVYGKECAKHPELAGRRYLPSNTCIECQRELNRAGNARRKAASKARDERLAKCLALFERMLCNDDMPVHWFTKSINEVLNNDIQ
jgi:hypothetical protein